VSTARCTRLSCSASAALFTGVAGALGAVVIQFVAPDSFTAGLSINFLIGIVIGGVASISGAFYGALFIQFVAELRRPDLQGRALGDLRRVPAGVCLSDADRGGRLCAAAHGRECGARGKSETPESRRVHV